MKNLYTLIALILFTSLTAFGQGKVDYDSRSRFYLGFNLGGTYHSNTEVDVNSLYRGGAGFTFGYSFGMKPGRLLSLDLQLRYLLAAYRGQSDAKYTLNTNTIDVLNDGSQPTQALTDYEAAYGYYVPNFHTWVNDWSLELKLNTNRLRERTGWNFFALGGIGYNRYHTEVDFYDNANLGSVKDEQDLFDKDLSISDYETSIVNQRDWMPSFGLGIERQITPNAAFTIMGRMTWTRNNDFDGLANTFSGTPASTNDRYHYASAGVKFYLRGHQNQYVEEEDEQIELNNTPVTGVAPTVIFKQPNTKMYLVNNPTYNIAAEVHYVAGKENITFTQNGKIVSNYNYSANTDKFNYSAYLQPGDNVFVIQAVNGFGKANAQTIIVYKLETKQLPIVTITNPHVTNQVVNQPNFNFTATVENVVGKENVSLNFNGVNVQNFYFNGINLSTALSLVPGKNIISVTGNNAAGSDTKSTIIIYEKSRAELPPVVTISNPASANSTVNVNQVNIIGQALHVSSKNDITVWINGTNTNSFSFNPNNKQVVFTAPLVFGTNSITIKGVNKDGQDQASVSVYYTQPVVKTPPVVTITNPANDNQVFKTQNITLYAVVSNVTSRNNVSVMVNNNAANNYAFNANTGALSLPLSLLSGRNVVTISANNADGSDSKTRVMLYKKAVIINPPTVVYTNPNQSPINSNSNTFNLVAQTTNVTSKSQITFRQNGVVVNTNNYSFLNATFNYQAALVTGANTFEISVSNASGMDSKLTVINYTETNLPCIAPTVGYVAPAPNSTVNNAAQLIEAQINNYTAGTSVRLTLNGVVLGAMSYNNITQIARKNVTLNLGSNTLEIDVANSCGTNKSTFILNYKVTSPPCSLPVVVIKSSASPIATNNYAFSAQVSGTITANQLTLLVNGQSQAFNFSNGKVTANLNLNAGANTMVLKAVNSCGNDAKSITVQVNPCTKPVVIIKSSTSSIATNNYAFSAQVSGTITANQLTLLVNGKSQAFNFSNGKVTANLNLNAGANTMVLKAVNSCGNDAKSITVQVNPCVQPTLQLISPLKNIGVTTLSTFVIKAKTSNDIKLQNITVKLNGNAIPFVFNVNTITVNVNGLKMGLNNINIEVVNDCGKVDLSYNITRNPCVKPVVQIINKPGTVASLNYNFSALVTGETNASAISLLVNGTKTPFKFSSSSSKISNSNLTASFSLKEGNNSIVLLANNSCGKTTKSLNVVAVTCVSPKLTPINPKGTKLSTKNASYSLTLGTVGVTGVKGLSVLLNGKVIKSTYLSNKITISIALLKMGLNTVKVTATNACGSASIVYSITRLTCEKPKIQILSSQAPTTTLTYQLSASISEMISKTGITLKLNGKSVPFTYSLKTRQLAASLVLVNGGNTISISAVNSCGSEVKTIRITGSNCTKPSVKAGYPTSLNVTTANSLFVLTLKTTHITNQNQISVTNNGVGIPFTYNSSSQQVSVSVTGMSSGMNNVKTTVSNACGSDSVTYVLNYTGSGSKKQSNGMNAVPKGKR
ncbi:hypothetical protein DNU06_01375 [Putridiphycobacter roseus]|uniref:Outer membrane protein beta-barrel domain-containing protein n=1 Tax=Putridiphycobacter roseus TaxID=2219161 RepID=A0A2W1N5T3_9FLAO|nr:hypothetical protein [Putridiphycobacter roseus]PZE18511.1 hypothetical protein DNU06_01375 [Putridiphycobacter roseus]